MEVPNFRIVPPDQYSTDELRFGYISGMFARVEQNSMFEMHLATSVLEMVVELQLHWWDIVLIKRVLRSRDMKRSDGSYSMALQLIRDSEM